MDFAVEPARAWLREALTSVGIDPSTPGGKTRAIEIRTTLTPGSYKIREDVIAAVRELVSASVAQYDMTEQAHERPRTTVSANPSSRFKLAKRERVSLKIAIEGPSGAGKTLGALMIASGLVDGDWSKVAFIDSENGSASYYVGSSFPYTDKNEQGERVNSVVTIGEFHHCVIEAPFSPSAYISAVNEAQSLPGVEVIVIDSISHEWDGPGGCLEIQQDKGGKYTDWKPVKAMHKQFIDAILQNKAHVIATMRSKTDYIQSEENGRKSIKKVGLKAVQQEQAEYEFGIVFAVDQESHKSSASKDRTNIFAPIQAPFAITPRVGITLKAWANTESVAQNGKEA